MKYARWANEDEMKKYLTPVNLKTGVKKAGTPMMYDDEYLYINDRSNHTLVIGSTGCGKTQVTTLPVTKLAMMTGESIIVNDVKGEIYDRTASELEKNDYKLVILNFDNANLGNSWNPFTLPYSLFKKGNRDKALELVEAFGYYLFSDFGVSNIDPFWVNSVIDYFTGITLYLFENANEDEINLNSVYETANVVSDNPKLLLDKIKKNTSIYYNVMGTLNSPIDTRSGIIATFNQKMKKYVCYEGLSNMMANTDFDITNISNEKTAVFIVSGNSSTYSNLIPLFVNQVFDSVDMYGNKEKTLNILLDEFDSMLPIKDFAKTINYARGINIRFVVVVKSYIDLVNTYGKDNAEIIKMCFSNIIYLLSNDIYTLEEISNLCGKTMNDNMETLPLITIEELKTMNHFEAIILIPRMMPFRTKLLPDYEINWGYEVVKKEIHSRVNNNVKVFDIDKMN